MKRIFTLAALLLLVMPPLIATAMPIPGLEEQALRDMIRLIQDLNRCKEEAGKALESCLPTVSDQETLGDDELSESILICDNEYLEALARCGERLAQPKSVLKAGELAGEFPS